MAKALFQIFLLNYPLSCACSELNQVALALSHISRIEFGSEAVGPRWSRRAGGGCRGVQVLQPSKVLHGMELDPATPGSTETLRY